MIEALKNVWLTLRGMNFYLEVTVAAFVAYFWLRHIVVIEVRRAVWVPVGVSLLGQLAYALKDLADRNDHFGLDDAVMIVFMSALQAGLASMIYTMAEKNGWIDKLGALVGKKIDDKDVSDAPK